jgi:hypothetical protein
MTHTLVCVVQSVCISEENTWTSNGCSIPRGGEEVVEVACGGGSTPPLPHSHRPHSCSRSPSLRPSSSASTSMSVVQRTQCSEVPAMRRHRGSQHGIAVGQGRVPHGGWVEQRLPGLVDGTVDESNEELVAHGLEVCHSGEAASSFAGASGGAWRRLGKR